MAIHALWPAAGGAAPFPQSPSRPAAAAPRPDESVMLSVPASSPWTDTGVLLRDGDQVSIRAWGSVRYADGGSAGARISGPAGLGSGGGCSSVVGDARVPSDALVANVAPELTLDGAGILVGTGRTLTVPVQNTTSPSGRLFLGVNHPAVLCDRSGFDSWGFRNSGSGAYTAQVTIRRRR